MNHKVLHIDAADGTFGYPLSFNSQDKMIHIHRYNKGLDFRAIDGALLGLSSPHWPCTSIWTSCPPPCPGD